MIVMPVVPRPELPQLPETTRKRSVPDTDDPQEMLTRYDIPRPLTTGPTRVPDTGEIQRTVTDRKARQNEYKPFFTQLGDAVPNRQHNRVVMVVPLLLIVSVLLFLFAYIASK
ncbi:MAG: hypothetical protein ABI882_09120 [Acidobacteriota bacterium]